MNVVNVLLARWGGLGDLMAVLPSIQLVRRILPSASLTLIAREEYGSLLLQSGLIDHLIREDTSGLLPLFADRPGLLDRRSDWLGRFDLTLIWLSSLEKGNLEKNLSSLVGAKRSYVIRYRQETDQPISRFFFEKTQEALEENRSQIFAFDECARLWPSSAADSSHSRAPARPTGHKEYVVIHPGSGGEKKRWPVGNFLEIAKRLGDRAVPGILVTGVAERGLEPLIARASRFPGWTWLHSPSLERLSQIFAGARLYLGNDSGVTHLAAACGTEVVAIYRAEFAHIWRPYGRAHLLIAGSPEDVSVELAWEIVAQVLCR